MSFFTNLEQFPMTHENFDGVIVPTTRRDIIAISYATLQLENIFNDSRGMNYARK